MRRHAATARPGRRPGARAIAVPDIAALALALAVVTATLPLSVLAGPFDNLGRNRPRFPTPIQRPAPPSPTYEIRTGNIFQSSSKSDSGDSGDNGYVPTYGGQKCEWYQHRAADGYSCVNYVCWPLCGKGFECVDGKCVTKSGPDCEWFERATWDGRCEKWMCWPLCPEGYACVNVQCVPKPQQPRTVVVQQPQPQPTPPQVVIQPQPEPEPQSQPQPQPEPEPQPCQPCAVGEYLILGIDPQDPERLLARAADGATVLINAGVAGAVLTYDASMEGLRTAARVEKKLQVPTQYVAGAVGEVVNKLPVGGKKDKENVVKVLTGGVKVKNPFGRRRLAASSSGLSMASVRAALRKGECVCAPAVAESFYDAVANEGQCSCDRLANEFASTVGSWQRKGKKEWDDFRGRLPELSIGLRRRRLLSELSQYDRRLLAHLIERNDLHLARKLLGGLNSPISIKTPTMGTIRDLIDPANVIPTAAAPIEQLLRAAGSQSCAACPSITPGDIWEQLSPVGQATVDGIVGAVAQIGDDLSRFSKDTQREIGGLYGKYVKPTIDAVLDDYLGCLDGVKGVAESAQQLKTKGSDVYSTAQRCGQIGSSAIGSFVDDIEDCKADYDVEMAKLRRDHPDASTGDEFGLEQYGELGGNVAASVVTSNPGPLIAWLRDQAIKQAIKIGTGAGPAACAVSQNLDKFIPALFMKLLSCLDVTKPCDNNLEFGEYTASAGVVQIECELDLSKAPIVGDVAKSATGDGRMNSLPHFLPWVEVDLGGKKQSASMEKCAKAFSVLSPSCPKPAADALDKEKELVNAAYCGHLPGRKEGDDCMFVAFGKEIDCQRRVGDAVRSSAASIAKGAKGAGGAADAVENMLKKLVEDVKASAKSLPPAIKAKAYGFGANAGAAIDAYGAAMINQVASNIASGKRPTEALATADGFNGLRVVAGTVSVQCSLMGQVFDGHVVPYVALDTRHGY